MSGMAMKRITIGLVVLAFVAQPVLVYAQQDRYEQKEREIEKKREDNNPLLKEYHDQQKRNAEIEQQYQRTLRATDTAAKPVKTDPWANMRGSDPSKR
jgi:DNA-binding transcriptional regulator of glucitol operon